METRLFEELRLFMLSSQPLLAVHPVCVLSLQCHHVRHAVINDFIVTIIAQLTSNRVQ